MIASQSFQLRKRKRINSQILASSKRLTYNVIGSTLLKKSV